MICTHLRHCRPRCAGVRAGEASPFSGRWLRALLLAPLMLTGCGGNDSGGGGALSYTVAATVSGLQGSGLVLENNGSDNLAVTKDGAVTFSTALVAGSAYAVSVKTQPSAPAQTCTVADGSGTVGAADVTNVSVSCTNNFPAIYTVSVTVSGWGGSPLVLELNGGGSLSISANGSATFSTKLSSTAPYSVTVLSQPVGPPPQTCNVTNGAGVIASSNVANVQVACVSNYSVGTTVQGLASSITLLLNGADPLTINATGSPSGTFTTLISSGANYAVTVGTQPSTPAQSCTVTNGSGTIATAGVTNVTVICSALVYAASVKGDWTDMTTLRPYYGMQAISSPLNYPENRAGASSWTDQSGNLWLFGGTNIFEDVQSTYISDNVLWRYTPSSGTWVWVNGNQSGTAEYGTKGTPSVNNSPAPTSGANSWVDPTTGNFWLFAGDLGNDLWEFNPGAGTWEWVNGSGGMPVLGVYGSQGTPSAGNFPGTRSQAVSWVDATGNFWVFGGNVLISTPPTTPYDTFGSSNDLWQYSPSSGLWTWMGGSVAGTNNGDVTGVGSGPRGVYGTLGSPSSANVPGGRSQAVSWRDASGNFWLFGGYGVDSVGHYGQLNDFWKYAPSTGTWEWVGGSNLAQSPGVYGTQGVASTANIPGARWGAVSWTDTAGNFWLFGGVGITAQPGEPGYIDTSDLWEFIPTAGTWTWLSGSYTVDKPSLKGTPGVPAAANTPGGLDSATSWTDAKGNLWLFGGTTQLGGQYLDDLWVYTPVTQ